MIGKKPDFNKNYFSNDKMIKYNKSQHKLIRIILKSI